VSIDLGFNDTGLTRTFNVGYSCRQQVMTHEFFNADSNVRILSAMEKNLKALCKACLKWNAVALTTPEEQIASRANM